MPNAVERGAFHSDPLDGVVVIIVSEFALLYSSYVAILYSNRRPATFHLCPSWG